MRTQAGRRWMSVVLVLVTAATLGGVAGCAKRQTGPRPADLPTTLPSEEEAQRAREDAREAIPVVPPGERSTVATMPAGAAGGPQEGAERYGYRVQLFATGEQALADQRAQEYQQLFEERVYVEFEGLLYKVQVGDCVSRSEADALRRRAMALGYEGAFVVDTIVRAE